MAFLDTVRDFLVKLRMQLGLGVRQDMESLEHLTEKPEIRAEYQARFSMKPLEHSSDFVNRKQELQKLKTAYENWKISQRMTLLIGEAGMGATSLLNYLRTELHPDACYLPDEGGLAAHSQLVKLFVRAWNLDECNSLQDLQKKIPEGPQVVIFENIERLFLRKVHGFNLLRDFLLFMHATKEQIYWIATINSYSYYYLRRSVDIASNFLSIIQIQPLELSEIREVILGRNEGYEIRYLKPEKMGRMMKWKLRNATFTKNQEILEAHFFDRLYAFAGGNISRSILYWLNAVRGVYDHKVFVRVHEPQAMGKVETAELFILEAILQHTALSAKSLDNILRQGRRSGTLTLEHLLAKGWIEARDVPKLTKPEYQVALSVLKEVKQKMREELYRKL